MNDKEAERLVNTYSDMISKICYTYLKSMTEVEDICQNVFLKLICHQLKFHSLEHEKAWVIRTTINMCKDYLKSAWIKRVIPLEEKAHSYVEQMEEDDKFLLSMVMKLKREYRLSIYLYYYENYTMKEIASLLNKSENAVYLYLSRGRKKLQKLLNQYEQEGI